MPNLDVVGLQVSEAPRDRFSSGICTARRVLRQLAAQVFLQRAILSQRDEKIYCGDRNRRYRTAPGQPRFAVRDLGIGAWDETQACGVPLQPAVRRSTQPRGMVLAEDMLLPSPSPVAYDDISVGAGQQFCDGHRSWLFCEQD